jgi:hypothetical protein
MYCVKNLINNNILFIGSWEECDIYVKINNNMKCYITLHK